MDARWRPVGTDGTASAAPPPRLPAFAPPCAPLRRASLFHLLCGASLHPFIAFRAFLTECTLHIPHSAVGGAVPDVPPPADWAAVHVLQERGNVVRRLPRPRARPAGVLPRLRARRPRRPPRGLVRARDRVPERVRMYMQRRAPRRCRPACRCIDHVYERECTTWTLPEKKKERSEKDCRVCVSGGGRERAGETDEGWRTRGTLGGCYKKKKSRGGTPKQGDGARPPNGPTHTHTTPNTTFSFSRVPLIG